MLIAPTRCVTSSVGRSSDLVTTLLNRLGNLGLLVVACALLLGGLAGGAVAHHFDTLSSTPIATEPGQQGIGAHKHKHQHGNQHDGGGGPQNGTPGDNPPETD